MWTKEGWGIEERATKGWWKEIKASRQEHLPLVQAPRSVDCPQTWYLPTRQAAQLRLKEDAPEDQLCYHHCRHRHSPKASLCHTHGHHGGPGRIMVWASMHVLCVVSMHGWATWHRTTNCNYPLHPPPSNHHLQAHLPCHSKGPNIVPSKPWWIQSLRGQHGTSGGLLVAFIAREWSNTRNQSDLIKKKTRQQAKWGCKFSLLVLPLQGWLLCWIVSVMFLASLQQGPAPHCSPQHNNTALITATSLIWLKLLSNWDQQPCIQMHSQCPPPFWIPLSHKQQKTSEWGRQRVSDTRQRHI